MVTVKATSTKFEHYEGDFEEKGNSFVGKFQLTDSCIIINGNDGEGIDIVFCLESANRPKHYHLIADQRKKEAKKLTLGYIQTLVEKIDHAVPEFLKSDPHFSLIRVVCSAWSTVDPETTIPGKTITYTRSELSQYLKPFSNHPIVTGFIDINYVNMSLVRLLLRVDEVVARSIRNEKTYFTSRQQLQEFIQSTVKKEEKQHRNQQNKRKNKKKKSQNSNSQQPVSASPELPEYQIPSDVLPMLFFLEDYYCDIVVDSTALNMQELAVSLSV